MCRHEMLNCPNSDNQQECGETHSALTLWRMLNVLTFYILMYPLYSKMGKKVKMITHFRFVLVIFYVGTSCSACKYHDKIVYVFLML